MALVLIGTVCGLGGAGLALALGGGWWLALAIWLVGGNLALLGAAALLYLARSRPDPEAAEEPDAPRLSPALRG